MCCWEALPHLMSCTARLGLLVLAVDEIHSHVVNGGAAGAIVIHLQRVCIVGL